MKKEEGKKFEEDFKKSIITPSVLIRLKDAGGWSNAENTRFTVKNICDFILFNHIDKTPYLLELKSTKGKSLPLDRLTQLDDMLKTLKGQTWAQGRFIVNFRDTQQTYSVDILKVEWYMNVYSRKSLPISFFEEFGKLLKQEKKRIRYTYFIENL